MKNALFLSGALTLALAAPHQANELGDIGQLDVQTISTSCSNQLLYDGLYQHAITAGENQDRSLMVYLSPDAKYNEYTVTITLGNDMDPRQYVKESGWLKLAEEKNFWLRILIPGEEG